MRVLCTALIPVALAACAAGRRGLAPDPRLGDQPRRWSSASHSPIALWVDSSAATPGWRPEFADIVADAATEWSSADVPVRFVRAAAPELADVRVHWKRWQPGTARGATTRWANARGEIVGADVTIVLARCRSGPVSSPRELRAIALHELGHALGLPHDPSRESIMYWETGPLSLTDHDLNALRAAYHVPPRPAAPVDVGLVSARGGRD